MAAFLVLGIGLGWTLAREERCISSQFRKPGDYLLGGLFPLRVLTTSAMDRTLPDVYMCERLYATGLVWALGMKFAVEEINNSTTLLPGIKLGYNIYDDCSEPIVALQPSLLFLTRTGSNRIGVLCNYTDYQPRVLAVIGPHSSQLCTVTAKLFSFFLIPQISYGATSQKLNSEEMYPSFFRTVPSDKIQLDAMVELLTSFKWNWIAVIGSDDEYGREGLSLLSSMAVSKSICVAYEGLIPADVLSPDFDKTLVSTIESVNKTNVNVIVLFSNDRTVRALFKECLRLGLGKKVWLATEAWVMSDVVTSLGRVDSIGTVIGFIIKAGNVSSFHEYAIRLFELSQQKSFCEASQKEANEVGSDVLGSQCPQCDQASLETIKGVLEHRQTFAVYTAVYSVAHALHNALGCESGRCNKSSVKPWQLLEEMKTLNFSTRNQSFQFDRYRSINKGYEVIGWSWKDGQIKYTTLGEFNGKLNINKSLLLFHTENQQKPTSQCLTTCQPGQIRRMKGFHLCCYDCIDCEKGTFCSSREDSACTPCPEHQWSPKRSTRCYDRSEKYLFWLEPLSLILLGLLFLALALTCLTGALFLKNLHTPVVQAAGGAMSLLALSSLAMMCVSTSLHIGKPSPTICKLSQPFFALCLNVCFSTILVKAFQIVLVHDFANSRRTFLHTLIQKQPWSIVASCLLAESLFCYWFVYDVPPVVVRNYALLPTQVLIQCKIESWPAFALIHGYNGILAFTSFLCTFMVQMPAKKYNVARGITFTMIAYFIALVFFIPTYTSVKQEYQPAVQMAAILLCTLGLLACLYLPKCYIIWFKPDRNTTEYFQDYTQERLEEKDCQD
ncbi:PREDICTED: taste receptor type 1 member 3 [Gekko japonicus]|uniref:Taste receptor type 1 member 3 n=1 Tax=Gekko japonicus TaxID=146911 RepID=A0ABM1KQV2_GEKJA|nr:PREDICTED: taste receptor type 1 member 3 [Gekko japonicus]